MLAAMNRIVLTAWIVVAVCVVAAIVAAVAQPLHWERTVGAAAVLGVIAAVLAVVQARKTSRG